MPNPMPGDVHVNAPLTNISVKFMNQAKNFIAARAFPVVPVSKKSGVYFQYPKGAWFRSEAAARAPGTETPGIGYSVTHGTYSCLPKGVHKDVDDQERSNQDAPLDGDKSATQLVTQNMLLRREKDFAANYFTTTIWTGSSTGTDIVPAVKWDDYTTPSTPIADIQNQIDAIESKTGFTPNKLVLAKDVWSALKNNPDFTSRIALSRDKLVTTDLLASLLELDEVLIARATENTAKEGAADAMSHLFTNQALLVYAPNTPMIDWPSAGYIFAWTGYLGATQDGIRIKKYRMEQYAADRIEGEIANDMKLVAPELGAFFNACLT